MAETNQALRSTGLGVRLRLVHTATVEGAETGDSTQYLQQLRDPNDGFFDEVPGLRDRYGADLVALITERMDGYCGRAFINHPRSRRGGESGFSVAKRSCLSGGGLFAHEIGHNLGAQHDWYETARPGAFQYSKGHVSLEGRFLDIMSYFNLCRDTSTQCARMLGYANPEVTRDGHRTGVPIGTNVTCVAGNTNNPPCDADIARTFLEMAPVVARYRDSRADVVVQHLLPGEVILPGAFIRSESGRFRLSYQGDGNLVLYDDGTGTVLWTTNTAGTGPGRAILQLDGNFVVYDPDGRPVWASGTVDNTNGFLLLQNDGNLVIFRSGGEPIWDRHM